MSFQLSNEEGISTTSGTSMDYSSHNDSNSSSSNHDTFSDDTFDPAPEDTVFIANQYKNTVSTTTTTSSSGAVYLSKENKLPPILMILGVVFQFFALFNMVHFFKSDNLSITNINNLYNFTFSFYALIFIGYAFFLIDAIVMYKKQIANGSLIAWAIICPVVYFFKRCIANGDSTFIAFLIVVFELGCGIFTSNTVIHSSYEAIGVEVNDTGIRGASLASSRIEDLSKCYIYFGHHGPFYYDQIIYYNITDPMYQYVSQASPAPDLLVVEGTTTMRGKEEPIIIQFNYDTLNIYRIYVGENVYSSQEKLTDILFIMVNNLPGVS